MQYAGLDIGGSKIAVRCQGADGQQRESLIPLSDDKAPTETMTEVVAALQALGRAHGPIDTLAIASAPSLDAEGTVARWPNRPGWTGTPVATTLSKALGCKVLWCDDGTAATVADAVALGASNLLHFSLGTGVGGGIFFEGRVLKDREPGHLIVHPGGRPCSCGRSGCLQAYASARSLAQSAPAPLTEAQEQAWSRDAADAIALCAANLIELFRPEIISLSGGLLGRFAQFPSWVQARLSDRRVKPSLALPSVVASPHGTQAAVLGALYLAQAERSGQTNLICQSFPPVH